MLKTELIWYTLQEKLPPKGAQILGVYRYLLDGEESIETENMSVYSSLESTTPIGCKSPPLTLETLELNIHEYIDSNCWNCRGYESSIRVVKTEDLIMWAHPVRFTAEQLEELK